MRRLCFSVIPFRVIGLGLTSILLAACDDSPRVAEPSPQSVHVAKATMLEQQHGADITGEVRAQIQTDLAFRLAGKVVERRVDVGSHVRAGDVLARIDDTEQRADVESAEAGLQAAQATLNQKTLAYQRYETLVESRAIAQATYDQAKEDLAIAQGTLESAQASLAIAKDALHHTELKAEADLKTLTIRDAIYYYLSHKPLTFLSEQNNADVLKEDLLGVINGYLTRGQLTKLYIENYLIR